MRSALIVYDQPDWVFERMANALIKYCHNWTINKTPMNLPLKLDRYNCRIDNYFYETFDIILWLPDYRINLLKKIGIAPEKLIIAIRCDVFRKDPAVARFYSDNKNLRKICAGIACANQSLKKRFEKLHPNVYYAPGGVDINIFRPIDRPWHNPPIAGWSGSVKNFSSDLRGLDLIEKACMSMKIGFKPCLREFKWRTEQEMVKYYQDEIDIYIDAHEHAGRQNGLLEAGACRKMLVATKAAGISEELISSGTDGFLCERSVNGIKGALFQAVTANRQKICSAARENIEKEWSWGKHAGIFEEMFNDIAKKQKG